MMKDSEYSNSNLPIKNERYWGHIGERRYAIKNKTGNQRFFLIRNKAMYLRELSLIIHVICSP